MQESGKILVYRFTVFDKELGRFVKSPLRATLERIKADSNYVVRESGILVDSSEIGSDGMALPETPLKGGVRSELGSDVRTDIFKAPANNSNDGAKR